MPTYKEFTRRDLFRFYRRSLRFGIFHKPLQFIYYRLTGKWRVEDQLRLACYCEPPMMFMRHGVMIPHAFGITLSVDSIGADCSIGHNVTIGTNRRGMAIEEGYSTGHKPRLGNLVVVYTNSVISGEISIGDCVVVAAGAFVNRDVPPKSVVYGRGDVRPLSEHHVRIIQSTLYHCINVYNIIPGLVYRDERLFIDTEYADKRKTLIDKLENLIRRKEVS